MSFTLETTDQYDATKYTPMGTVMSNNVEAVSFFRAIIGAFQAPFGGKNVAIQTAVDRLTERGMIEFKNKVAATFPNTLKVVGLRTSIAEVGGEDQNTFMVLHISGTCLAPFGQSGGKRSGGKQKRKTKSSKRNNRKTRRNV
jgi:uncharacterized protein YbjQ (UPF0145 family)